MRRCYVWSGAATKPTIISPANQVEIIQTVEGLQEWLDYNRPNSASE
ncbi:hypothetical protein [Rubripirellula lacrimiformis]|nr:hypothetical protein [Rubripirellula lacrimiformis]